MSKKTDEPKGAWSADAPKFSLQILRTVYDLQFVGRPVLWPSPDQDGKLVLKPSDITPVRLKVVPAIAIFACLFSPPKRGHIDGNFLDDVSVALRFLRCARLLRTVRNTLFGADQLPTMGLAFSFIRPDHVPVVIGHGIAKIDELPTDRYALGVDDFRARFVRPWISDGFCWLFEIRVGGNPVFWQIKVFKKDSFSTFELPRDAQNKLTFVLGRTYDEMAGCYVRPDLCFVLTKSGLASLRDTTNTNATTKIKPGRKRRKPDALDKLVEQIIRDGEAILGRIPVKSIMEMRKYKALIPNGTTAEKLRSRIRRALEAKFPDPPVR